MAKIENACIWFAAFLLKALVNRVNRHRCVTSRSQPCVGVCDGNSWRFDFRCLALCHKYNYDTVETSASIAMEPSSLPKSAPDEGIIRRPFNVTFFFSAAVSNGGINSRSADSINVIGFSLGSHSRRHPGRSALG